MKRHPKKKPKPSETAIPATSPQPGSLQGEVEREPNVFKRALLILGPGLVTGASDDDPSGIGTYAAAGATLGYGTLWMAVLTFPFMAAVQYTCAKVGLVHGTGFAAVLRRHYPRWLLYPIVFTLAAANTFNAGADIGAIASGINLLVPIPVPYLIVPVGLLILALLVWGSYRLIANTFKWLTLALFAYIGSALFARPDWAGVLWGTLVPTIGTDAPSLAVLVGILGTTISPYLFFWQASQEAEEKRARWGWRARRRGATDAELRYAGWDVATGMFVSNLVMYFIILATGATLHQEGHTEIHTAAEAAEALKPLAGDAAEALLALGLIGAGFLAVPVLTGSAAYAVAEAFAWRTGLDQKPHRARGFYAVITVSTLAGLLLNFTGVNPVDALLWAAVLNGFLTPPLLAVVLLVANNKEVMGKRANGLLLNVLGWSTVVLMAAAAVGLVLTWGAG